MGFTPLTLVSLQKRKKVDRISFEEMLEMASLGSKVLQIRSVEFAGKYQVPLRVLSSFDNDDDGAFRRRL